MSSINTQATGSRPRLLHRDHEGDRLADLGLGPVALPGRLEVGDPRPGEEPADQHQAQQGEHRAGEQPEVEDDRDDQDADDGEEPAHQTMTLAPLGRHGRPCRAAPRPPTPVVTLRSRLSGLRMIRWPRMAGASRLMSSGVMNVMPADRRQRLRRPVQRQRGPRAAAEQDVGMLAAAADQLDDVPAELVVDADRPHRLLALDDLVGRDHGLEVVDRVLELEPGEHRRLLLGRRIAEIEADQEPVELGLGQAGTSPRGPRGSGSRSTRNGGVRSYVVPSTETLPLGHRLQERRLGPRRGPVDLVGQDDLREDRAGPELELGRLRVEDRGAGDVRRQQVGRALHPLERRPDAAGQGPREHRLGHARHVLEQDVPLGEIGDQRQDDLLPLADDDLLDVGDDLLAGRRDVRHAPSS